MTGKSALIQAGDRETGGSSLPRRTMIEEHLAAAVEYLSPTAWYEGRARGGRYPLAMIGFGDLDPGGFDGPVLNVRMPLLDRGSQVEAWWSDTPVAYGHSGGVHYARSTTVLFGVLELPEREDSTLQEVTRRAYLRILDFLVEQGEWQVLRIWNYLPDINRRHGGLERYAHFCIGRHEAFAQRTWNIPSSAPAACALGSRSGPLQIYFLAAATAGRQIENPRQLPAYRYPERYGPRSPSFARATLARTGSLACLFISGTASVVGHQTLHAGDIRGQCRETLTNLEVLAAHCSWPNGPCLEAIEPAAYKVYLRHAEDHAVARSILGPCLGPRADVLYLHADICRSDLLVEIEGIWTTPAFP